MSPETETAHRVARSINGSGGGDHEAGEAPKKKRGRPPKKKAREAEAGGGHEAGTAGNGGDGSGEVLRVTGGWPESGGEMTLQAQLERLLTAVRENSAIIAEHRAYISEDYRIVDERVDGFNRKAFKLCVQLMGWIRNDEQQKAADFLRAFDQYRRLLRIDEAGTIDMFDEAGADGGAAAAEDVDWPAET